LDAAGITDAAVQRLVAEQTPESEVLEFKQALWSRSPRPRPPWTEEQEFAKDVGALANHRGGVLLVGVSEVGGVATSIAFEVRHLGRTITRWAAQIVAWHRSHVTNGPTEAVNNLAKRIKRVAFGLVNFRHHRVRCLLYAGKPDWTLLPTIQP
jgi:hypothetical protein